MDLYNNCMKYNLIAEYTRSHSYICVTVAYASEAVLCLWIKLSLLTSLALWPGKLVVHWTVRYPVFWCLDRWKRNRPGRRTSSPICHLGPLRLTEASHFCSVFNTLPLYTAVLCFPPDAHQEAAAVEDVSQTDGSEKCDCCFTCRVIGPVPGQTCCCTSDSIEADSTDAYTSCISCTIVVLTHTMPFGIRSYFT